MSRRLRARARVRAQEAASLVVEPVSMASCVRCAQGQGCGGALFQRSLRGGDQAWRLPYAGPQRAVGDMVWLEIDPQHIHRMALWAWGLPLLMLLAVALAWASLATALAAPVSAFLMLALGVVHLRYGPARGVAPMRVLADDDGSALQDVAACG